MLFFYLELINEEDREDFQALYEENYLAMYHVALSVLHHQQDAENAVHEAFLKLAEHWDRYKRLGDKERLALCITITKHASVDLVRKNNRFTDLGEAPEEKGMDVLSILEEQEDLEAAIHILKNLSEPLKTVLVMKYYLGLRNLEIAKALGISKRAVEMRVHRARETVRKALEERYRA